LTITVYSVFCFVDIGDKLLSLSRVFADNTSLGYASQDEDQIKYVINHDLHEPCLFNLYFNLRKTHMCLETLFIKFSTCLFHFASSLNVIPKCCQDEDQIKYVINHDLHEPGDWSKRWLMSFNPDKTEIMLFKNVENYVFRDTFY
jgi:hypothetical protein